MSSQTLSRRSFLKTAALTGAVAATAGVAQPLSALAATTDTVDESMYMAGIGFCTYSACGNCAHEVWVRDGKVVKTEVWKESPTGDIPCLRGRGAILQRTYGPRRLLYPMRRVEGTERGAGQWERISWDEAMADIKKNLGAVIEKYGPSSVAFFGGNGNQGMFGTENIDFYTRMVNILGWTKYASSYDDNIAYGQQTVLGGSIYMPSAQVVPVEKVTYHIYIGRNVGPCGPYNWRNVINELRSGAKFVVVDPVYTHLANMAETWINLRPGSDTVLLMGAINEVFNRKAEVTDFMRDYTVGPILVRDDNGRFLRQSDVDGTERAPEDDMGLQGNTYFFINNRPAPIISPDAPMVFDPETQTAVPMDSVAEPALDGHYVINGIPCTTAMTIMRERVAEFTPAKVAEICRITEAKFHKFVDAAIDPGSTFECGFGANWFSNSVQVGKAFTTLQVVTGKYAAPGMVYYAAVNGAYFTKNYTVPFPPAFPMAALPHFVEKGTCMGKPFPQKALVAVGQGGLIGGAGRQKYIREVYPKIDYIIGIDVVSCDTMDYCDIMLPAAANYEKWDINASMRYMDKCIDPLGEAKEDFEIGVMLGKMFGDEADFNKTKEEYAEECLASWEQTYLGDTLEAFKTNHFANFYFAKMIDRYDTNTGKIEFYVDVPMPKVPFDETVDLSNDHMFYWKPPVEAWDGTPEWDKFPFTLVSTRHFAGFHTQYFDTEWCTEYEPEPVVRINPEDAEKFGIAHGEYVECYNDRGHAVAKAVYSEAVQPGMLVYPKGWDPRQHKSGCWSNLPLEYRTYDGQDALLFDCRVGIRPWKEA